MIQRLFVFRGVGLAVRDGSAPQFAHSAIIARMVKTHGLEPEVVYRVGVLSICALYRFIGNERGAS